MVTILSTELRDDPTGKGYAAFLPDAPGHVADLLNASTETMVKTRMVTARAILSECASGATILDKLEAVSAASSTVKWAVKFLAQEAGIDVGANATQVMIAQLVTQNVLSASEGSQLKNLAMQPASRAEVLGIGYVTVLDINKAK